MYSVHLISEDLIQLQGKRAPAPEQSDCGFTWSDAYTPCLCANWFAHCLAVTSRRLPWGGANLRAFGWREDVNLLEYEIDQTQDIVEEWNGIMMGGKWMMTARQTNTYSSTLENSWHRILTGTIWKGKRHNNLQIQRKSTSIQYMYLWKIPIYMYTVYKPKETGLTLGMD